MKKFVYQVVMILACIAQQNCLASPACVDSKADNFVVADATGDLTAAGWGGVLLLQRVDATDRVLLHRCSEREGNTCYFATHVKPGKYYFQQVLPEGNNNLDYPVSTAKTWFMVTGGGVDYIGHWNIHRSGRLASKFEINYALSELDTSVELCQLKQKTLFLDQTNSPSIQIAN